MSLANINLTPELYHYLQQHSLHEPASLAAIRAFGSTLAMGGMQISPEQGQFLGLLVELISARKILEIGTFIGYSALAMALHLPADGKIICCEIEPEWAAIATDFWQKADMQHRIELQLGPALTTMNRLITEQHSETFDLIFIDADKQNYINYYENALVLLRQGGLIAIDNVLWYGKVASKEHMDASTEAIRMLNLKVFNDVRVTMSMLPIGDGLTLARKR